MPTPRIVPSSSLLRALRESSISFQCVRKASPSSIRPRKPERLYSTTKEKVERSFQGQLYESTAQRLERDRAEQRRFAQQRGESSGGRNSAITFGDYAQGPNPIYCAYKL